MKISKVNNIIYIISNQNYIFSFHATFPAMRIGIGESYTNDEISKKIFDNSFEVDENFHSSIKKYIDSEGISIKSNYYDVCKILSDYLKLSQDDLDKIFGYDKDAIELCTKIEKDNKFLFYIHLYDTCRYYLIKWKGDKERAKKFIERFCAEKENVIVDIFPSKEDRERPTWQSESWLLHTFHNNWGDELNRIIKEAVEKYPSFNDIDYAAYYVEKQLEDIKSYEMKNILKKKAIDNFNEN